MSARGGAIVLLYGEIMRRWLVAFLLPMLVGAIVRAGDTADLVPLSELGKREYRGFVGGLYPDGRNQRPDAHERVGVLLATQVGPLVGQGMASREGKVGPVSGGLAHTTREFSAFLGLA